MKRVTKRGVSIKVRKVDLLPPVPKFKFKKAAIIFCLVFLLGFLVINWQFFYKFVSFAFSGKQQAFYFTKKSLPKSNQSYGQSNFLNIASIKVAAPIVYAESNNEEVLQQALENGVVHYPGTPEPGQPGNVYIFGHSSDLVFKKGAYKSVFAALPDLTTEDYIEVTNKQGEKFIYKVFETRVVESTDTSVLYQDYSKKTLTLQTSYPIGTALKRYIVKAEIVE